MYGFNHFKAALNDSGAKVKSHNGVEVNAIDVLSHSLKVIIFYCFFHLYFNFFLLVFRKFYLFHVF
jgi:hypothetical protein